MLLTNPEGVTSEHSRGWLTKGRQIVAETTLPLGAAGHSAGGAAVSRSRVCRAVLCEREALVLAAFLFVREESPSVHAHQSKARGEIVKNKPLEPLNFS